jgi:hypothetical protein
MYVRSVQDSEMSVELFHIRISVNSLIFFAWDFLS